jgi:hypothetical protein
MESKGGRAEMLAIQNSTQIETAHPEEKIAHGDKSENQLEGIARKKNRKNNGMGVFAKLLAGLVSKKTLMQGQGNPDGLGPPESAKKAAFPSLKDGKGLKKSKESLSVTGDDRQIELDSQQLFNFGFPLLVPGEDKSAGISFEQASLKTGSSGQTGFPERKFPFKKGEMAEKNNTGEFQNAALESKNKDKLLKTRDNPEKKLAD